MTREIVYTLLGSVLATVVSIGAAVAAPPAPIEVPEPSSLALIAMGIGGVAWLKFRQRK